jgi:hypothetical protein
VTQLSETRKKADAEPAKIPTIMASKSHLITKRKTGIKSTERCKVLKKLII